MSPCFTAWSWFSSGVPKIECLLRQLPIEFHLFSAAEKQSWEESIDDIALIKDTLEFYVGGTAEPIGRWRGFKGPRGYVPGHRADKGRGGKGMTELHIIGLLPGPEAKQLEERLISYSLATYGVYPAGLCSNVARDSRGLQEDRPNFIYVARRCHVLRDTDTAQGSKGEN